MNDFVCVIYELHISETSFYKHPINSRKAELTEMIFDFYPADYYAQQSRMQKVFLEKYAGNKTAEEFIAYQRYEAELFNRTMVMCFISGKKSDRAFSMP